MINKKKFLIVLGFLLVFILLFAFNNKVFAAENVVIDIMNNTSITNSKIISSDTNNLYYFKTLKGAIYHVTLEGLSGRNIYTTDEVVVGNDCNLVTAIADGQTYDFVGTGDLFIIYALGQQYDNVISVTVDYTGTYDGTVSSLVDNLTLQNLWLQFNPVVILIAIGVLFALGFYLFKRSSKGTSKHQAKM